jgi:hypothetical protein
MAYGNQLADLEGIREMISVDGWTNEEFQAFIAQRQQLQDLRSLPAA